MALSSTSSESIIWASTKHPVSTTTPPSSTASTSSPRRRWSGPRSRRLGPQTLPPLRLRPASSAGSPRSSRCAPSPARSRARRARAAAAPPRRRQTRARWRARAPVVLGGARCAGYALWSRWIPGRAAYSHLCATQKRWPFSREGSKN